MSALVFSCFPQHVRKARNTPFSQQKTRADISPAKTAPPRPRQFWFRVRLLGWLCQLCIVCTSASCLPLIGFLSLHTWPIHRWSCSRRFGCRIRLGCAAFWSRLPSWSTLLMKRFVPRVPDVFFMRTSFFFGFSSSLIAEIEAHRYRRSHWRFATLAVLGGGVWRGRNARLGLSGRRGSFDSDRSNVFGYQAWTFTHYGAFGCHKCKAVSTCTRAPCFANLTFVIFLLRFA